MWKRTIPYIRRKNRSPPAGISSSAVKERADCVVIGAGVVGLAIARALALKGREVLVLEAAPTFGSSTSSRNSQVIHAGIYYPRNSHKTLFCVKGRQLLYQYSDERGIPCKQVGKLVVATCRSEVSKLYRFFDRGRENGVTSLKMMDGAEAERMEPELRCVKAIHSPVTGIIDSHSLMLSFVGEAESHGATISYNSTVIGGNIEDDKLNLHVVESRYLEDCESESSLQHGLTLVPDMVINSTGLSAIPLSKRFKGLSSSSLPTAYFARGCYFTLSNTKAPPFQRLIYPLPEDGGIGIHVTLDLDGQVKFGPDVEWISGIPDVPTFLNKFNYTVNPNNGERFYSEIRKYYPNLKDGSLSPGYAGIRPKTCGPKEAAADFIIQGEDEHGVSGLVNLFGIESPGLTSSMAIAEYIASKYSN